MVCLGIYGLIKLDFHPFISHGEDIMVQISYHDQTFEVWVEPYSTLGEVLERFDFDDTVAIDQINPNQILKHRDKYVVPLKMDVPCISINTADSEMLIQLNGVGPAIAERIIAYRSEHGLFQSIEDIMQIKGIGILTFEKMRDQLCI